jgi:hypothetical protein
MEDLLVAERRYPHRIGQTYRLKYNPNHRWFYFPEMRRDEPLVFKVYDSEKTAERGSRPTPRSTILRRRRMRDRGKASRYGDSRFSRRRVAKTEKLNSTFEQRQSHRRRFQA